MAIRQSQEIVTFTKPFVISGYPQQLPAGAYLVEIEEEPIEGVSFMAYRRTATTLHVARVPGRPGESQAWSVDPAALASALALDRLQTDPPSG